MLSEPESEDHANIFTRAFGKLCEAENRKNLDSLNILLKNNTNFNNNDQHWKDLNESREFILTLSLIFMVISRINTRIPVPSDT